MTIKSLASDAIAPVQAFFTENEGAVEYRGPSFDTYIATGRAGTGTTRRLRLDWRLGEQASPTAHAKRISLILGMFADELADLIENGDTASTDPFYITMDGANKLGKQPTSVEIVAATIDSAPATSGSGKAVNHTIWTVFNVEWS